MGRHPLNLALRFALELCALYALGLWGWQARDDAFRFVIALGAPLLGAAAWGVFAVPGDPSRSGRAPVPIPGTLRLALEFLFFGLAAWALLDAGFVKLATVFGAVVAAHYLFSLDRIRWLLAQSRQ